jgi:hypothetical protein
MDPRIGDLGEHRSAGRPTDLPRTDGVSARAVEFFRADLLGGEPRELAQQALAGLLLLLRRRGDVRAERPAGATHEGSRHHGVGERLAVAQLLEEPPPEPAGDSAEELGVESLGVTVAGAVECSECLRLSRSSTHEHGIRPGGALERRASRCRPGEAPRACRRPLARGH